MGQLCGASIAGTVSTGQTDVLRCSSLMKRFPGVVALKGLDFVGLSGEVHAVLGENGAGKSTFIKILSGAVQPDEGQIDLFGQPVAISSPRVARQLGVHVAYQELSLVPDLTVSQNIWLDLARPNRAGILTRGSLRARTLELFQRLGASPVDPDLRVKALSVSARQVVEIVRSVAVRPRVLIFDEATAALPATETRWALDLARYMATQGVLVLFISHRLPEIREMADRVTVLRDGQAVLTSRMEEVGDDDLIEAMLGRKPQRLYPPPLRPPESEAVLTVCDLRVGDRLKQISFELHRGEILGVGGLQGQGQSSLLLALFGVARADGEVRVEGKPVRIRSPKEAFDAGIGLALVPEDRRYQGLLLSKSIRENVSLPVLSRLTRRGLLSLRAERALVSKAMAQLQVKATTIDQPVTTLSGGNQQKVVIAKLLLVGAKILLFHDLTRGIDVGTKAEIFELARQLAASGHALILYSSDNQELVHMCDRIMVLRSGTISAMLEGKRRTEADIMQAAFAMKGEADGRHDA